MKPRLLQKKDVYTFDYPEAIAYAEMQRSIFWPPDEIEVSKDLQSIMVDATEAESSGITEVLKLFTNYELLAGHEYWGGKVAKQFPRPDIQMMANAFSFFELNVHAPFYNKINEVQNLNTDAFYKSYADDPVLVDRMKFLENLMKDKDIAKSLAVFSMVEGAILYSSFAFLKHFQSEGKNKMTNVVRGINFSVRDENLHSEAGAWLFRTLVKEYEELPDNPINIKELHATIYEAAHVIYEHEEHIIDRLFEKGDIKGITDTQMKHFVQSRIDICLSNLGLERVFKPTYNPIAKWFYDGINAIQFHDFFTGTGSEYNRNWNMEGFRWVKPEDIPLGHGFPISHLPSDEVMQEHLKKIMGEER